MELLKNNMPSLPENTTQEAPNDFLSLMSALSKYKLTDEANEIVEEYDGEIRIAKLQELLKTAPDKLGAKLRRAAGDDRVITQINFRKLKSVLQICDVLRRRDAFFVLLEDHGLDPKSVLR